MKTRFITYRERSPRNIVRATTIVRTAVRLAAINRSMDLSHLTYDQMDFIEEKKTRPNFKYTTYKGWLFGKAWKCYDESTNTVTMPERLKTIG